MGYGNKDPYTVQINNPSLDTLNNQLGTTNENVATLTAQLAQNISHTGIEIGQYANGDGTDETTKIQNTLNANAGKIFVFPYGKSYKVNGLTIPDNTIIIGYGVKLYNSSAGPVISSIGNGVKIYGLEIQGQGNSSYIDNDRGLQMIGSSVNNQITGLLLEDCYIHDFGGYGIYLSFSNGIKIINTKIQNIGYAGIMGLSVSNVKVSKTHIKGLTPGTSGNAYGIAFSKVSSSDLTTYPRSKDCIASECLIEDNTLWEALDTHAGDNIKFIDNTIRNCKSGVAIVDVSNIAPISCLADGNTIYGIGTGYGIAVTGAEGSIGSSTQKAEKCVVSNNILVNCGQEGNTLSGAVYVRDTLGLVITDNSIKDCFIAGIQVYHDNTGFVIDSNSIVDVQSSSFSATGGVYLQSGYNTGAIDGNTLLKVNAALNTYVSKRGIYIGSTTGNDLLLGSNYNTFEIPYNGTENSTVYHKLLGTNVKLYAGFGSPETVYSAGVGSLYIDKNGSTSTTLYVKESGTSNTGWKAK